MVFGFLLVKVESGVVFYNFLGFLWFGGRVWFLFCFLGRCNFFCFKYKIEVKVVFFLRFWGFFFGCLFLEVFVFF